MSVFEEGRKPEDQEKASEQLGDGTSEHDQA